MADFDKTFKRGGGCFAFIFVATSMVVATIFCLVCANFFYVGSMVADVEFVIDEDVNHPGYARALPVVDGYPTQGTEQYVLPVDQPYTFPIGCVRTNNTRGDFGPRCE